MYRAQMNIRNKRTSLLCIKNAQVHVLTNVGTRPVETSHNTPLNFKSGQSLILNETQGKE